MTNHPQMRSAQGLTWEQLADAFKTVYQGYSVALPEGPDFIRRHCENYDIRLDLSPVYLDEEGRPVALALLGLRGKRAWIGAFGVAPEQRGRGLSHALAEQCLSRAREAGAEWIQLEVLADNLAAQATYYRAGFLFRRLLGVMEGAEIECPSSAPSEPCWQREKQTPDAKIRRLSNEPVGSPLYYRLLDSGWSVTHQQFELHRQV